MRRTLISFCCGAIASAVLLFSVPTWYSNMGGLLFGGGWAKVSSQCDSRGTRCVYLRSETGLGINDVPVIAIYSSQRRAAAAGVASRRVECDPGAIVHVEWRDTVLAVSSKDGSCSFHGTGAFYPKVLLLES
ncbi:hypothetical protein [Frigidibacter sp.]|uniref:hypothetical protein n=1 Tax=Frigidibacter sp. TaxID=2586418 RepID=UPI002733617B|nr:hypothetical protein [Frigidibacter sp.]MDP3339415.1 hypothetical protein [Frigidibacter sp.]